MSDWSHGYDVSMGYTYGFFREMGPEWLDFCARISGSEAPERCGGYRYLELGSGQGFGLCLLAAANPDAEFVGVDFQPEHIAHSKELAAAAGLSNIRFFEADFMNLALGWPEDYGTFHYVAMHGIFSWISPELRAAVLQCVVNATRPGGLVYVSYNAQPGWLGATPIRHILRLARERDGDSKPAAQSAADSIALLSTLAGANAPVFSALPGLAPKIDAMKGRAESYLVHEYLGEHWNPFWHSDVRGEFGKAGLHYAGSATLADNLVREFLPDPLFEAVTGQQDAVFREDLQDFIVNQAFRRDIYSMGPPRSAGAYSPARDQALLYALAAPSEGAPVSFETCFGQVNWDAAVYSRALQFLRSGPRSLQTLFELGSGTAWQPRHVVLLMLHANMLGLGAAQTGSAAAAERMNRVVAQAACEGAPYSFLAAARLGSAIGATPTELMLLDAWFHDPDAVAEGLASRLVRLGRSAPADARAAASAFVAEIVPRWRQLGVLT